MDSGGFIEPDLAFIAELKKNGGGDLKKCYQCATCSVVCNVTPDDHPFPRKEMMLAQWGAADQLVYSPDVWLCHNCGDCTANCPRGAKPADVLAAVRNASFRQLAVPQVMGSMLSVPAWLLPILAVPVAILLLVLASSGGLALPEGTITYSKLFPIWLIDSVFVPVGIFAVTASFLSIKKFWKGMERLSPLPRDADMMAAVKDTVVEIIFHKKFAKCEANSQRRWGHMLFFFGFIALFITTNMVMAYHYVLDRQTPLHLLDPVKMLGNLGAVAAFAGVTWVVLRRIFGKGETGSATYYDWTFILALYLTILTGIGSELARLADMPGMAYTVYFMHLTLIFFLLAYMPFSKFSHMMYRAAAMVFSVAAGRNRQ